MSSIPNVAIPRAISRDPKEKSTSNTSELLLGLAVTPPVIALALGAFAFKRLRSLASDLARKVDTSGGNAAPEVTVDAVEVEKGGQLPVPV